MFDEGRKRRRRRAKERYEVAAEEHAIENEASAALVLAINHPVRRAVLRSIHAVDGPISPKEIADQIPWDLPSVAFHSRELQARGLLTLHDVVPVRGSKQHFYISNVRENELLAGILDGTLEDDQLLFEDVM